MTGMPNLTTDRLMIRPYTLDDLEAIHQILNEAFGESTLEKHREWLEWMTRNYTALARLYQPPYGDRAIVLKESDTLIGSVGIVPSYGPFGKLPYFRERSKEPVSDLSTPEIGLFWGLGNQFRGQDMQPKRHRR